MVDDNFPHRAFPCNECPVRSDNADNPRSKFVTSRWDELHGTIDDGTGGTAPYGTPMFGCHKGEPGTNDDLACAGWLAAFGWRNVTVRLAVAFGRLDQAALEPGENWPPLYDTWDAMVAGQTLRPGDPTDHLKGCAMPAPPPMHGEERVYTVSEAAAYLDVSNATVDRWTRDGKLPAIRLPSRQRRWREHDLEAARLGRPFPRRDTTGRVVAESPSPAGQTAGDGTTPGRGE